MNKVLPNKCPVCGVDLQLSRREIIGFEGKVKHILHNRYYVSEEMVQQAIHMVHNQQQTTNNQQVTTNY